MHSGFYWPCFVVDPLEPTFRISVAEFGYIFTTQNRPDFCAEYTDKKDNKIFLIYKEIQSGAAAKSYMRKGFLIYEEMRKYFPIYE
jgi:hypothetical protein